jgi:8-oxo-dGTP pyrophosphatase MutT (NUDIX family)
MTALVPEPTFAYERRYAVAGRWAGGYLGRRNSRGAIRMPIAVQRKAVVYCLKGEELLVFTQPAFLLESGVQVPAGTVRDDEDPRAAAARELREETGKDCFEVQRFLGRTFYDQTPYRDEIHERYFFVAQPTQPLPDRWEGREEHDGLQPSTIFSFFWIPVRQGHVLVAGQGALLGLASRVPRD